MATPRYIDANAVNPELAFGGQSDFAIDCRNAVVELLAKVPTVDAVSVVKCKDCKWKKSELIAGQKHDRCHNPDYGMASGVDLNSNDYCSYGERKNVETE